MERTMIRTPVVFVLGAGASAPYGFPSGYDLGEDVRKQVREGGSLCHRLKEVVEPALVDAFPGEYRRGGFRSLDTFVAYRKEFRDLVTAAMIHALAPLEREDELLDPTRQKANVDQDWYAYMLDKILPRTAEDFATNQLKIITFNFDRSFERRLHLAIRSRYRLEEAEASKVASHLPVLHIHGDLGAPAWDHTLGGQDDGTTPRAYQPDSWPSNPDIVQAYARRLKLIDDDIPESHLNTARSWLRNASAICFLGFGYAALNLARLDVGSLQNPTIEGTALGLEDGELDRAKRCFHPDAMGYLFHGRAERSDRPRLRELLRTEDVLGFLRRRLDIHAR
jgi:hypothetical protein